VCALLIQRAARPWIEHIPFVLFFLVVAFVGSIGGWGPGLLSVAVSAVCGYTFLSTSSKPLLTAGAFIGAALFTPVGALIAAFAAMVRAGFDERERAIRARDEFISMAAHELRTPITSLSLVTANVRRLQDQGDPAAAVRVVMRQIGALQRQTARLTTLVENLLDVSRIGSGRLHLDLEQVDISAVVREVVERFEGELRDTGVQLAVNAPAPVVGRWDEMRLDQIVTNLLSNAVKYGEKRPIEVSVRGNGMDAVLAVADRGVGISAEDQARIFRRFERGASAFGRGGFGLGLWIVREIVTALEGKVEVESTPGEGATFTVVLPLAGPAR
jgi:signal transduction histidine kinase